MHKPTLLLSPLLKHIYSIVYVIILYFTALNVGDCPLFQLMRKDKKRRSRLHGYLKTQHTDLGEHRQTDAASYHTAKLNWN